MSTETQVRIFWGALFWGFVIYISLTAHDAFTSTPVGTYTPPQPPCHDYGGRYNPCR